MCGILHGRISDAVLISRSIVDVFAVAKAIAAIIFIVMAITTILTSFPVNSISAGIGCVGC